MYTFVNILAYGFIIAIASLITTLLVKEQSDKNKAIVDTKESEQHALHKLKPKGKNTALFVTVLLFGILSVLYKVLLQPSIKEFYSSDKDHNNIGLSYYQNGKYQMAVQEYNISIQKNPKNYNAYNNRGLAYYQLEQYTNSLEDYDKAIQLNDTLSVAFANRGLAYISTGNYKAALVDLNKAISHDPRDASLYNNRGIAYTALYQYNEALSDFNKAIEINGKWAMAYYHRACIYYYLGDKYNSKKDADKALLFGFSKDNDFLGLYKR